MDITFADLFVRVSEQNHQFVISDQPGNGGTEVELTAPVTLCEVFGAKLVPFFVSHRASTSTSGVQGAQVNAFQPLMCDIRRLPSTIEA